MFDREEERGREREKCRFCRVTDGSDFIEKVPK